MSDSATIVFVSVETPFSKACPTNVEVNAQAPCHSEHTANETGKSSVRIRRCADTLYRHQDKRGSGVKEQCFSVSTGSPPSHISRHADIPLEVLRGVLGVELQSIALTFRCAPFSVGTENSIGSCVCVCLPLHLCMCEYLSEEEEEEKEEEEKEGEEEEEEEEEDTRSHSLILEQSVQRGTLIQERSRLGPKLVGSK